MPPILDVSIGTCFVFLLFSLVVSTSTEFILSLLNGRAEFLQMALNGLLGGHEPDNSGEPKNGCLKWIVWLWKLRILRLWKFISFRFMVGLLAGIPFLLFLNQWRCCLIGTLCAFCAGFWRFFIFHSPPTRRVQDFFNHGLINALSPDGKNPSYIPAGAFVTVVLDLISRDWKKNAGNDSKAPIQMQSLIDRFNASPDDPLYSSLLALSKAVGGCDLEKFKTDVEAWFNSSMERVTGWYKRHAQLWMLCIGFILAAVVNVDSIRIIQILSTDPQLRAAVVEQAKDYAKPSGAAPSNGSGELAADQKLESFQKAVTNLGGTGIPIGWDHAQLASLGLAGKHISLGTILWDGWDWPHIKRLGNAISSRWGRIVMLIAGWGLTAIAGSLGAPFWFDILNRIMNIRNAGKNPGEPDPMQHQAQVCAAVNLNKSLTSHSPGVVP